MKKLFLIFFVMLCNVSNMQVMHRRNFAAMLASAQSKRMYNKHSYLKNDQANVFKQKPDPFLYWMGFLCLYLVYKEKERNAQKA